MSDGKTQFEMVLDRIEAFQDKVEKNRDGIATVLRIIFKVVTLAFKFVPMKANEKEAYNDIMSISNDVIKIVDQPNP